MWVCHCKTAETDIKDCFLKHFQPEYCMFYVLQAFLSKSVFSVVILLRLCWSIMTLKQPKKKTWMAGEMRGSFLPKVL